MSVRSREWRQLAISPITGVFLLLSMTDGANSQGLGEVPEKPMEILEWVAKHWKGSGWGANGSKNYMRPLDDSGWRARMLAMQKLVALGAKAEPALTGLLKSDNAALQIFAAQAFAYLPAAKPTGELTKVLKSSPENAARLYAADALAIRGGEEFKKLFEEQRQTESNRDVKKHLGYALERDGVAIEPEVIEALKTWDARTINSAKIGKAAPDFELKALNGNTVKLSQYRGKSAVVLVFIYGDT